MPLFSKETLEVAVSFCEIGGVALGLIAAGLLFISVLANRPLKKIAERSQIAMQESLAKQQKRAANAERALLELQERIKPRRLTAKQNEDFVKTLKVLPNGTIDFGYTAGGGDESLTFAQQLLPLFKEAGWTVRNEASIANHLEIQVIGIGILTRGPIGPDPAKPPSAYINLTPTLATLRAAFRAVGIDVQFINWHPGKDDTPEVVVGSKPEF